MLARLWYRQIVQGKKTFDQVPAGLKEDVRALLEADGRWNSGEGNPPGDEEAG